MGGGASCSRRSSRLTFFACSAASVPPPLLHQCFAAGAPLIKDTALTSSLYAPFLVAAWATLQCDNIFVNGQKGDLRIGDLGLSRRKVVADREETMMTMAGNTNTRLITRPHCALIAPLPARL